MYPILRLGFHAWRARHAPPLGLFDAHVSHHRCWPWDLDPWRELNNGRTLTLFDLGRVPAFRRLRFMRAVSENGWRLAVAGVSVRYRRRVRAFDRITMRTRLIGWDDRFWYVEQSMWRDGDCTTHMLLRGAASGPDGIVSPARVIATVGHVAESPPLPDWVAAWIAAEAARPWPPHAG
jgi:acyl-CoA thioesterase FadM